MNDELYTLLKSICWRPTRVPEAAAWLRGFLSEHLTGHQTWRTSDLLAAMGVTDPKQSKTIQQALWHIRKSGLVDDCFRRDATKRHMGHSLLVWQRPLSDVKPPAQAPVDIKPEEF